MSGIKQELDGLYLNPNEKWVQHLENLQNKFSEIDTEKDFIGTTIFSPLYPEIIKDLTHEMRNKYSIESRFAEYATVELGFNRFYKDIQQYNIIWQTTLVKKIKRAFSSQKVINVQTSC